MWEKDSELFIHQSVQNHTDFSQSIDLYAAVQDWDKRGDLKSDWLLKGLENWTEEHR